MHDRPRLLVAAHGTASPLGSATTARLVDALRAERPDTSVDLAFLDVAEPRLPEVLRKSGERPTVLVPLLLSTGYHVQTDIPAATAPYAHVRVARHLGPHPLLAAALADRLVDHPGDQERSVLLVGAGSSRSDAAAELAEAGRLLGVRLGRAVAVATLGEDVRARVAELAPVTVATYLLAEGHFYDTLRSAVAGLAPLASPLGVHPALIRLIWSRYDET